MSMLDTVRTAIPAEARERVYIIAAAAITLLASWGVVDAAAVPAWAALAAAVITLGFAILHSTSMVRTALYSVLLAVQGVAQLYGIFTDTQWASIAGLAAAVLGTSVAAAKAPTPISNGVLTVSLEPDEFRTVREHELTDEAPAPQAGGADN